MTYRHEPDQLNASVEELYTEVLEPTEIDDVFIEFDDNDGTTFSVEFGDFEDQPFRGFKVSGLVPEHVDTDAVADAVSLEATDVRRDIVVFKSGADDAATAVDELGEIATEMGVSVGHMRSAKRRQSKLDSGTNSPGR